MCLSAVATTVVLVADLSSFQLENSVSLWFYIKFHTMLSFFFFFQVWGKGEKGVDFYHLSSESLSRRDKHIGNTYNNAGQSITKLEMI